MVYCEKTDESQCRNLCQRQCECLQYSRVYDSTLAGKREQEQIIIQSNTGRGPVPEPDTREPESVFEAASSHIGRGLRLVFLEDTIMLDEEQKYPSINQFYYPISFNDEDHKIEIVILESPLEKGLVGMVTSKLFHDNIALVVDYSPNEYLDYDYACLSHYRPSDRYAVHMEEFIYTGLMAQDSMAMTILFHELGHYYHNDIDSPDYLTVYDEQRKTSVLDGNANERELLADRFAVDYLGTEIVIKGLQDLKKATLERFDNECDPESFKLNQKELQYRIDALFNITNS